MSPITTTPLHKPQLRLDRNHPSGKIEPESCPDFSNLIACGRWVVAEFWPAVQSRLGSIISKDELNRQRLAKSFVKLV
jgi:hypothetical protein